jgi:hypothetical protein
MVVVVDARAGTGNKDAWVKGDKMNIMREHVAGGVGADGSA